MVKTCRKNLWALIAASTMLTGVPVAASPSATIERTQWNGKAALCISNGITEAVVVPAISRVIRFGFVGGPNPLWINNTGEYHRLGGWTNRGGSRTWLGPEAR